MKKVKIDHSEQFELLKLKTKLFCNKPGFLASFKRFEAYELAIDIYECLCGRQEDLITYESYVMIDKNGILLTITKN
jgi:hypothetical protein